MKDLKKSTRDALERACLEGGLLHGSVGTGKTHAAAAWFKAQISLEAAWERAYSTFSGMSLGLEWQSDAVWVNVPLWLSELRNVIGAGESTAKAIRAVRKASALVLDDIAGERSSDWTADVLYCIVADREGMQLPTLATTNLPLTDLEAWHPRLASRLMGMTRIPMTGPDRRLQKGADNAAS